MIINALNKSTADIVYYMYELIHLNVVRRSGATGKVAYVAKA